MKKVKKDPSKRNLYASIIGLVIILLCCFTPLLVVLFGVLGLSALVGYLDYVLFPLLFLFIILTFVFYSKYESCNKDND